jgi:hypothetical protein
MSENFTDKFKRRGTEAAKIGAGVYIAQLFLSSIIGDNTPSSGLVKGAIGTAAGGPVGMGIMVDGALDIIPKLVNGGGLVGAIGGGGAGGRGVM